MKIKPLLTAAAIVPIAIGGMSLTGCSSSEPCVGTWFTDVEVNDEEYLGILEIYGNNTGAFVAVKEGDDTKDSLYVANEWKKTDENTYSLTTANGSIYTLEYDPVTETITQDNGYVYVKADDIYGSWIGDKDKNGNEVNVMIYFKSDGTLEYSLVDKNGVQKDFTGSWENNYDGTYSLSSSDEGDTEWTMNDSKDKLMTAEGYTFTRGTIDYSNHILAGSWYNEDIDTTAFFFANGTGIIKSPNSILNFSWKADSKGNISLAGTSGVIKGKNYTWVIADDEITGPFTGSFIKD